MAHLPSRADVTLGSDEDCLIARAPTEGNAEDRLADEVERQRAAIAFLARASAILSEQDAPEAVVERTARLAVPFLADWCSVALLGADGQVEGAADAHADPDKERLVRAALERLPAHVPGREGPAIARATEMPAVTPEVTDELLGEIAFDEEHLALLRELQPRSWIVVPMRAGDAVIGAMSLATGPSGRRYGPEDLAIAEDLAVRSAIAVQTARLRRAARAHARRGDESLALLDTLFASAPIGLAYFDRDLRFRRVNAKLAEINGAPAEAHIGRTIVEMVPGMTDAVTERLQHILDTGEPILDEEVTGHLREGEPRRSFLVSYYPVHEPERGSILGIGAVVSEITDRQRLDEERAQLLARAERARAEAEAAQRRSELLAEASVRLDASLDYDETLRALARVAVPEIADACTVHVLEPDGSIRWVALAHRDPAVEAAAWEMADRFPMPIDLPEGPPVVLRTGEPHLVPEFTEETLRALSVSPEHLEILRAFGQRSAMSVPLRRGGHGTVGALSFIITEGDRRYGPEDVLLAVELARRAELAVENARLYTELRDAEERARETSTQLEIILRGIADGVTAQDVNGRIIFANDAAVRTLGYASADELVAALPSEIMKRFEIFTEAGDPFPPERLPSRRALAGETETDTVVRFRVKATGEEHWSMVKARPIFGPDGTPIMAINIIEDVTESKLVEHDQRFLVEASRILAASLDFDTTLERVARLAVPDVADWCGVDLLEENGTLRRVGLAHVDPAMVEMAKEFAERYPPNLEEPTGVGEVLRTGRAELYPFVPDELLTGAAQDEEHLMMMRKLGLGSIMIVPMVARGRTLGVITFVTDAKSRIFDEKALSLAEELGRRAAVAIDNARLFRDRSHIARTLQESLLPPELPSIPGFQLAARFHAGGEAFDVGGDFYDVFETGDDTWAVVIGDVVGHGADAAALTALIRYTARAAAMRESRPSRVLSTVNDALHRQRRSDEQFCTALYASVDPRTTPARILLANGGHPPALVLRADGTVDQVSPPGMLIGAVRELHVVDHPVAIGPGDALLLYTDGVTEARMDGEPFGEERLRALLESCAGMDAEGIVEHIEQTVVGLEGHPRDDVALLALRMV